MNTIHIFPHSGNAIPEILQGKLLPGLTKSEIAETIEVNRDSGFEQILDILKSRGETVFSYPYARVLTDANRLHLEHQMPEHPYRGSKLVNFTNELRQELFEKYLKPWQMQIIRTVSENPNAIIIHWHSMDTYSVGNSNLSTNSNKGELRPAGQIVSRVDFKTESLHPYFGNLSEQIVEGQLLDSTKAEAALTIFNKHLKNFVKTETEREFVADRPYKLFGNQPDGARIFGPILSSLASWVHGNKINKQLVFEVRKDLFEISETTVALQKSIIEIIELLQN